MKIVLSLLFLTVIATACTFSFTSVQTDGRADDVIDQTQSPSNTIKPDLELHPMVKMNVPF